jgi:hypothetical protein
MRYRPAVPVLMLPVSAIRRQGSVVEPVRDLELLSRYQLKQHGIFMRCFTLYLNVSDYKHPHIIIAYLGVGQQIVCF